MDTETGRIYPPDEMDARLRAKEAHEQLDEHQAEFERRYAEGGIVEVSDEVAARMQAVGEGAVMVSKPTAVIQPAPGGPVPVSPPQLISRGPARRSKNPTHERKLVVMEWIVMGVDEEDGRGGGSLAMEFYLAKGPADADGLRSRLQALPLPDGAIDRVVHVQPARRWPLSDDELLVTLEQHRMYAAAIIAGREAEAEQSDQEVADDGPEK